MGFVGVFGNDSDGVGNSLLACLLAFNAFSGTYGDKPFCSCC